MVKSVGLVLHLSKEPDELSQCSKHDHSTINIVLLIIIIIIIDDITPCYVNDSYYKFITTTHYITPNHVTVIGI